MNREAWLEAATEELRPMFELACRPLPATVRVSCGWPSRSGTATNKRRIGECWSPKNAEDSVAQIYISPVLSDGVRVLDTLVHELVHAAVGCEHGHKKPFKDCATRIGLEGKMTSTHAGAELSKRLHELVEKLGDYPHASLKIFQRQKQGTRMLKIQCPGCGWSARTTAQWIDAGLPTCTCGEELVEVE